MRVVDDAAFLADFGGALSSGDTAEKMAILTEKNIEVRLALSLEQIKKELQLSRIQQDIGKKVEEKVRKAHEDHMLREQLKAGLGNLSTKTGSETGFLAQIETDYWTEIFWDEFQTRQQNRFLRRETGF